MNNSWNNTLVKKEDVKENIKKINEVSKNIIIIEFIGFYLEFILDEDILFSKNIIKVKIKNYNLKLGKVDDDYRTIRLNIEQFYSYFNALMNALGILYEKRLEERISNSTEKGDKNYGEDESSFCPICEENKVNLSLPCNHFFCEQCIKDWIIKSETCPLCRLKLKQNKKKEGPETPAGIIGSERWSVLSNDENTEQEMKKDNIDKFLKITNNLFNTK